MECRTAQLWPKIHPQVTQMLCLDNQKGAHAGVGANGHESHSRALHEATAVVVWWWRPVYCSGSCFRPLSPG